MNEISVLMHLLSRKINLFQVGATEEEILEYLNINDRNKAIHFQYLIVNLSNYLELLGLRIKYNPLDFHWFISFESETSETVSANPFEGKPKLAATLFCTLMLCLKNSGLAKIHEIAEIRKKKNIKEDLKEMEKLGYLEIEHNLNQVHLTPLIGYQLDLEKLFVKLSLKLINENQKENKD